MMKTVALLCALVSMGALSACQSECKDMSKKVMQPTSAAEALINTYKTSQDVTNGCPALLDTLKTLPEGAQTLRDIANDKFTDSYSTCVDWEYGTRWVYSCWGAGGWHHGPWGGGYENCQSYPEDYRYCAQWEHHSDHNNGYAQAIDLSANLDSMYAKANAMCGVARDARSNDSLAAAHDLSSFIQTVIQPQSEQVYALACN